MYVCLVDDRYGLTHGDNYTSNVPFDQLSSIYWNASMRHSTHIRFDKHLSFYFVHHSSSLKHLFSGSYGMETE